MELTLTREVIHVYLKLIDSHVISLSIYNSSMPIITDHTIELHYAVDYTVLRSNCNDIHTILKELHINPVCVI